MYGDITSMCDSIQKRFYKIYSHPLFVIQLLSVFGYIYTALDIVTIVYKMGGKSFKRFTRFYMVI
jgi:hypothetical protein